MNRNGACLTIIKAAAVAKPSALIQYGAAYANAAIQHDMVGEEWRVQCLYILNNLSGWQGAQAREVKAWLKEESKRK
jgi:1-aminocyclopropane-1-carboxylate deaminase/D-cysteine desulfhydrase-like pyridoxal-dependent ACC family enzyme